MKGTGLTLMTVLLVAIPIYSQKYNYVDVDTVLSLNKVIYCHSIHTPDGNAVWADFASEIHRSIDGGNSWEEIVVPDVVDWTSLRPLNTDTAFFSAMYSGFYKTMDGGKSWIDMNKKENHPNHFHFFDINDGMMVDMKLETPGIISGVGDSLRIWRTSNGGNTWIEVTEPERPAFLPGEAVYHNANNMNRQTIGDILFFGTSAGRIFRSYDRGNTWDAFYTGLGENQFIISIGSHGTKNMMVLSDGGDWGTDFKTSFTNDDGKSWMTNSVDYGSAGIAAIPGHDSSFVLLKGVYYGDDVGLFITHDAGVTYSKLHDIPCHTLTFVNDNTAIMSSTYKFNTGGLDSDGLIRLKFRYKDPAGIEYDNTDEIRIYPNPTINILTIETYIPGQHSIEISSLNGKLLHNFEMEENSHQIDFSYFQNGVYFITIRSKDFVTTRKIIKY